MFPKHAPLSIHAFIWVHFGHSGKIHSIHPSCVRTHFFSKICLCSEWWNFGKFIFQKRVGFYLTRTFIFIIFFLFLSISFSQSLQEKIRDSLQIGYSWHLWLHVMENKVCNWKYTTPTFFSISYKISQSKYNNAWQITESNNDIFSLDITTNSNNVEHMKALMLNTWK